MYCTKLFSLSVRHMAVQFVIEHRILNKRHLNGKNAAVIELFDKLWEQFFVVGYPVQASV